MANYHHEIVRCGSGRHEIHRHNQAINQKSLRGEQETARTKKPRTGQMHDLNFFPEVVKDWQCLVLTADMAKNSAFP